MQEEEIEVLIGKERKVLAKREKKIGRLWREILEMATGNRTRGGEICRNVETGSGENFAIKILDKEKHKMIGQVNYFF